MRPEFRHEVRTHGHRLLARRRLCARACPTRRRAHIELVRLYTTVLRETTNWLCEDSRNAAPAGRLVANAAEFATSLEIVTFNHALVIENDL
jgi:hypothetical protein